jgi:CBS domain-containing protein
MTVKKLLSDKPQKVIWHVKPEDTVIAARQLMADKNIGALLVQENDQLVGIFSERDYARKVILVGKNSTDTLIGDIMTSKVITVGLDSDIKDCMKLFSDKKFRHLPVVENDKVIGILSIGDIVNSLIKEQEDHINYLEAYISS